MARLADQPMVGMLDAQVVVSLRHDSKEWHPVIVVVKALKK